MEPQLIATITVPKPRTCQRTACHADTHPDDLTWIESRQPTRPGIWVCLACLQYYRDKNKKKTENTASAMQATLTVQASHSGVRQHVNAAQRGDDHVVRAIGMPPPPLPSQAAAKRALLGPSVVSSLLSNPHGIYVSPQDQTPVLPENAGYTASHAHYEAWKAYFRKKASVAGSGASEVITITVTLVHLVPNRKSPKQIHTIREEVGDIPVHIGAAQLKEVAYAVILPQFIAWCPQYHLKIDACTLRKGSGLGVEISPPPKAPEDKTAPLDIDAISAQYFKTKGPRKIFVPSNKSLALNLVISHDEYLSIMEHQDALECEDPATPTNDSKPPVLNVRNKRKEPPTTPQKRPETSGRRKTTAPTPDEFKPTALFDGKIPTSKLNGELTKDGDTPFQHQLPTTAAIPSGTVVPSPSLRVDIASLQLALSAQTAPGPKDTRNILKSITLDCRLYTPPSFSLQELIDRGTTKLDILKFPSKLVTISYGAGRPKSGTFKTAWDGTSSQPLFSLTSHEICVKQAHVRDSTDNTNKIVHGASQLDLLLVKINCNLWGSALQKLVVSFIQEKDRELGASRSPPSVPHMYFVSAGIAISESEPKQVFLVEEHINTSPDTGGMWVKYLNNDSPVPKLFKDPERTCRSLFLSFSQHVQYELTEGNVFISDYQGGELALTDPQIITSPDLSGLVPLFSGGNLNFSSFIEMHKCNHFCKYYGLRPFDVEVERDPLFLRSLSKEKTDEVMPVRLCADNATDVGQGSAPMQLSTQI